MTQQRRLPRVGTMATMPSRLETFRKVFPVIHAQVDHMFIYLDGYDAVPDFLRGVDRLSVFHAEKVGDLHASSRFLCVRQLKEPAIIFCVDDDIIYPPDYVEKMSAALEKADGKILLGVHGRVFIPPHRSYARHALSVPFDHKSRTSQYMHELGAGTSCFRSDVLNIDPREWTHVTMDDLYLALEAQRRGMPRIAIERQQNWLVPYATEQPDSLWVQTKKDDTVQTKLMHQLMRLYFDRASVRWPPVVEA